MFERITFHNYITMSLYSKKKKKAANLHIKSLIGSSDDLKLTGKPDAVNYYYINVGTRSCVT